jgi:hypothetical protein
MEDCRAVKRLEQCKSERVREKEEQWIMSSEQRLF